MQVLKTTHPLPLPTASHDENSEGCRVQRTSVGMGQSKKGAVASRTCAGPQLDAGTSSNRRTLSKAIVGFRFQMYLDWTRSHTEEAMIFQAAQIGGWGTMLRPRDDRSSAPCSLDPKCPAPCEDGRLAAQQGPGQEDRTNA